ncbi:hypothetical protein AC13_1574 [Escherichia coli 2-011-08_S3_C2]|jgi:hypothetical protein|nr:hypothetical protein AC13_1574 [Escherichia coli 2-011-08_S3_C2]
MVFWWRVCGCCFPVAEKESIRRLAGYQLPVEIFKYLTIPQLDDCLAAGEFVKNYIAW